MPISQDTAIYHPAAERCRTRIAVHRCTACAWGNAIAQHGVLHVEGATRAVHHRTAGASLEGMGLRVVVTVQHRGSARVRGVFASMPQHGAADMGVKDSPPRGKRAAVECQGSTARDMVHREGL